jgi:hypothetical protein
MIVQYILISIATTTLVPTNQVVKKVCGVHTGPAVVMHSGKLHHAKQAKVYATTEYHSHNTLFFALTAAQQILSQDVQMLFVDNHLTMVREKF